jgi:hypothetical protein
LARVSKDGFSFFPPRLRRGWPSESEVGWGLGRGLREESKNPTPTLPEVGEGEEHYETVAGLRRYFPVLTSRAKRSVSRSSAQACTMVRWGTSSKALRTS